ncbi:gp436 family protein [Snodgrassella sp. CFCC 13594]|uniref:gp436 family protein n=1 Tax=Snodgrassella sp. CFCC 13594 TaxID=1775559 RepID=UPI00082B04AC|nr:DUF1320 domain-containing protein [Snodgrassella sp. CFCC 13594]
MYITRDDVAESMSLLELAQLSNDDPAMANSEPDWQVVDRAIAYACELADGYLQGRYPLPLTDSTSMLRLWCTDIARHWLHRRRINTADFPKPLEMAYQDALKQLTLVRDGKLHLGVRGTDDQATDALQPEPGAYHVRAAPKQNWEGY